MSEGRKNNSVTRTATGTNRENLLDNLTLSDGKSVDLERKTFKFKNTLSRDDSENTNKVYANQQKMEAKARKYKQDNLIDLTQEQVDGLNVRFKERANEVIRRNSFQGREQLILTNRNN